MSRRLALPIAALLALLAGAAGCVSVDLLGLDRPLEEVTIREGAGPKVLVIDVAGRIDLREERGLVLREPSVVERVRTRLDRARRDDDVAALLLRIDSPGGTATASEVLYREILAFKRERGVPVAAQLTGLATSGGYYVAMAADHVTAYPTTVTGSIGVLFVNVNLAELLERHGVADETVVSGPRKDAGSPLRPMSDVERAQFQAVVDDLFARFLEVVRAGRPGLSEEVLRDVSDGRILSARQAAALGLVDEIGDLDASVAALARALGRDDLRVVAYRRRGRGDADVLPRAPDAPLALRALGALAGAAPEPGFHYLWWPGGMR